MNKVFVTQQEGGGVSITTITPEMFNPLSRTRALLREKGFDFSDNSGGKAEKALKAMIDAMIIEQKKPIYLATAKQLAGLLSELKTYEFASEDEAITEDMNDEKKQNALAARATREQNLKDTQIKINLYHANIAHVVYMDAQLIAERDQAIINFTENYQVDEEDAEIAQSEIFDFEIAHYRKKLAIPEHLKTRIVDKDALPKDRTFREAWTDDKPTPTVDVDANKAIAIHKNRLRELRKPILAALDIEYQRADEMGDAAQKQKIAQKKKALRDITSQSFASDPDVLKNQIPPILTAAS